MGIGGFYGRWVAKRMARAVRQQIPGGLSSLSIDMNGVIHEVLQKVYGYVSVHPKADPEEKARVERANAMAREQFHRLGAEATRQLYFEQLGQELLATVAAVRPHDTLIMAVDGVAPGSKIQQQRQRRYRAGERGGTGMVFDTNSVTPGTEFMLALDTYLQGWIKEYRLHMPPKVIYSSHLVPGEGEHKIMDFYRNGEVKPSSPDAEGHLLLGRDADLIVLSLVAPLEQIYVMHNLKEDRSGNNVVDIGALRRELKNRMVGESRKPGAEARKESHLNDFVLISTLVGNDFLPHVPAFAPAMMEEIIEMMLTLYSTLDVSLVKPQPKGSRQPSSVNWEGLACFLTALSHYEQWALDQQANLKLKFPSRFIEAAHSRGRGVSYATFRDAWYNNALGSSGHHGVVQIESLLGASGASGANPVNGAEVGLMAVNFLSGMAWVQRYYSGGTSAINTGWIYHYHHAPMLWDLAAIARGVVSKPEVLNRVNSGPGDLIFAPVHQLLAVLPPRSFGLLPPQVGALLRPDSLIADVFPRSFVTEFDGLNEEHAGVARVPFVSRNRIIMAVESVRGDGIWLKAWEGGENIYSLINPTESANYVRKARDYDARFKRWVPTAEVFTKKKPLIRGGEVVFSAGSVPLGAQAPQTPLRSRREMREPAGREVLTKSKMEALQAPVEKLPIVTNYLNFPVLSPLPFDPDRPPYGVSLPPLKNVEFAPMPTFPVNTRWPDRKILKRLNGALARPKVKA